MSLSHSGTRTTRAPSISSLLPCQHGSNLHVSNNSTVPDQVQVTGSTYHRLGSSLIVHLIHQPDPRLQISNDRIVIVLFLGESRTACAIPVLPGQTVKTERLKSGQRTPRCYIFRWMKSSEIMISIPGRHTSDDFTERILRRSRALRWCSIFQLSAAIRILLARDADDHQ